MLLKVRAALGVEGKKALAAEGGCPKLPTRQAALERINAGIYITLTDSTQQVHGVSNPILNFYSGGKKKSKTCGKKYGLFGINLEKSDEEGKGFVVFGVVMLSQLSCGIALLFVPQKWEGAILTSACWLSLTTAFWISLVGDE